MRRKNSRFLSFIIAILALTVLLSACATSSPTGSGGAPTDDGAPTGDPVQSPADGDITIGVLVPTSGTEAFYGRDMMNSYQLAVEEINADGGVLGRNVVLFQADDACDANTATQAAARIIAEDVDFVVGGYCSGATIPALQQFYDAGLMMLISAANSTRITELGLNQSFMLNSPGTHAAVTLIELCKYLGAENVALIHQGDDYTQNLSDICREALPEAGINIATVEVMEKGSPDVSAIVTSIRNSGADFVYWCGYHADGGTVIRQLRNGGFEGYIAVGDGSASIDLIAAAGEAGEGVFITSPPFVEFAEGGEAFIEAFRAKNNTDPGTYATLAYDTIYLLKAAIEEAGTLETATVRDVVQNIEFQGLSGLIKFTPERELAFSNFMILQIKDEKFELVTLS